MAWNATLAERKIDPLLPDFLHLDLQIWAQSAQKLSTKLRLQGDLATNLISFAAKNG
jgi:hypothetical protein